MHLVSFLEFLECTLEPFLSSTSSHIKRSLRVASSQCVEVLTQKEKIRLPSWKVGRATFK